MTPRRILHARPPSVDSLQPWAVVLGGSSRGAERLDRHDSVLSRIANQAWHDKAVALWDSDDVLDWLQHVGLTELMMLVQGTCTFTITRATNNTQAVDFNKAIAVTPLR